MNNYTLYMNSGRIVGVYSGPVPELQFSDGYIEGSYSGENNYVLLGVVTTRDDNPSVQSKSTILANGEDVVEISNIPNPSLVTISGNGVNSFNVTDGFFHFSTTERGKYTITVDSFPIKQKAFEVDAI